MNITAAGRIRRLFKWVERTPLHPQWLVLRQRRIVDDWVVGHARHRVVDIGCGNSTLRGRLPDYIGLDYPTTVALGYLGNADIYCDAAKLPIASGSADTVLLLDVLEHVADPGQVLFEVRRILRPGGKCLVHVPFLYPLHDAPHDFARWTRYGLVELFQSKGFTVREIHGSMCAIESASALTAIALAATTLGVEGGSWMKRCAAGVLLPLVPAINLFGWTMGRIGGGGTLMPFSFRAMFVMA